MQRQRNRWGIVIASSAVVWALTGTGTAANAEDATVSAGSDPAATTASSNATNRQQECAQNREEFKAQREKIRSDFRTARAEETILHDRIRQAVHAGDAETAQALREQLRTMRQTHRQQFRQDVQELQNARRQMMVERRQSCRQAMGANNDGAVSRKECQSYGKSRGDIDTNGDVAQYEKQERQEKREARRNEFRQDRCEAGQCGLRQDSRELQGDQHWSRYDRRDLWCDGQGFRETRREWYQNGQRSAWGNQGCPRSMSGNNGVCGQGRGR